MVNQNCFTMPQFLDSHQFAGTEKRLKEVQASPPDEFGVAHINILYNQKANKLFCHLNAPDEEAVRKHHEKLGIKLDWVTEVKTTA